MDQSPYAIRAGGSHNGYNQHISRKTVKNSFNKSVDMPSFFANNKSYEHGKVFLYDANEIRSGSDYFKTSHNNRLIHSYNVPMKDKSKKYIHIEKEDPSSPYGM